jgi:CheY-like chemotaxis protein
MDSQSPMPAEDFRLLFEATPSALLILRPDGVFTIAVASDAYLKETLTVREEITVRAEDGLGIGLALVKSLVEQNQGTVSASSKGTGRGSEFTVRLPRVEGPPADATVSEENPVRVESKSLRILVVEDNVDVAESLGMVLEILGNVVAVEHEAQSAIKRAQQEPFDVYILDIGLPGMNGYELAHELRALPGCERAVFVAHTGYGQEEDKRMSAEAGFAHHLVKPVAIQELQQVLSDIAG